MIKPKKTTLVLIAIGTGLSAAVIWYAVTCLKELAVWESEVNSLDDLVNQLNNAFVQTKITEKAVQGIL